MNWSLEKRSIKSLKKHPNNPRKLTTNQLNQLKISLDKFGLIDKPIITKDGLVIGGHQRLEVLKKLGHKEVECWVANQEMSDEDIDELNIRLNKNTGDWDWEALANLWELPKLIEWGFEAQEILGNVDTDDNEKETKPRKSKSTTCPACGHEF